MLAMFAAPAFAADADTICATLYTYLADGARLNGASGAMFEAGAIKAEQAHLQHNPTEDEERYALSVIDGAATIREGLAQGAITNGTVQITATRCNNHYFPGEGQQLAFPDDWWADQR
jgi:hypothetical protein